MSSSDSGAPEGHAEQQGSHGNEEVHASTGADGHGEHGGGNPLLKFEPNVAFWTFLTFVVLAFALRKLAWGPMLANLERREKSIRDSLEGAEKARNDASSALAEQQKVLAEARKEAQELLARSRGDAQRARDEMVEKARVEAAKIVESGRQTIEREKVTAIQEIRAAAVDLALDASSRLLGSRIDDQKSRELVARYVGELGEQREGGRA